MNDLILSQSEGLVKQKGNEMTELKVIGRENVGGYEFTGIEGGFVQGKRGMLVRDIAEIHERTAREINQNIERNRNRFKNGIEIIDLKRSEFQVILSDLKFTAKQIANSKHIYMLSERGYAKLLKILEDDKAWEIYDLFVDEYFDMRTAIKDSQEKLPSEIQLLQRTINVVADQEKELNQVKDDISYLKRDFGLPEDKAEDLKSAVGRQTLNALGGVESNANRNASIRGKTYSALYRELNHYFHVTRYRKIPAESFDTAMKYVNNWIPSTNLRLEIQEINSQLDFGF